MNIIARYTRANIKSNRTRIPLIVLCIAIASLMFGASIVVPLTTRNYAEEQTRSLYGSSDIYIAESTDNNNPITSLYYMPKEVIEASEYVVGIFALQGTIQFSGKTMSANLIGVDYKDIELFNPPVIEEGSTDNIGQNEMVVSRHYANENNLEVGDRCRFIYAGRYYTLKVAAIAENSGVFKWKTNNNIIVNKATVNSIAPSFVPVPAMFNICVIKLKDDSIENQEWAKSLIKEEYPDWNVDFSTDQEQIDRILKNNTGPMMLCTSIVIIYCVFIIMLTMEIVFSERTKQFATMKSLGASKGTQLRSILLEALFYGFIGGVLGVVFARIVLQVLLSLPDRYMFQGVTFKYYAGIFAFAFVLSIFCSIIPAIKSLKQSIRQTMLNKNPSKLAMAILQIVSLAIFITSSVIAATQPVGRNIFISPILFLAIFTSALILVPYILRYLILIVAKIFKFVSFSVIYTQNSFMNSSLKVVSRILFFSLFLVTFLVSAVGTLNEYSSSQLETDYYTVSIDNIYDGNGELIIQDLKTRQFVDSAIPAMYFKNSSFVIDGKKEPVVKLVGMSNNNLLDSYSQVVVDNKTEVFLKLNSGRNYILANLRYKYINKLEIGDEIEMVINVHGTEVKTDVIIAGFMDTYEEEGYNAVMNINTLMNVIEFDNFNSVYVKCDPSDLDLVVEYVQKRFGNAYIINKFYESQKLRSEVTKTPIIIFKGYNLLIIGMSILFVVAGLYLALRRNLRAHKTMNILGMGTNQFVKTNFYQIAYISLGVVAMTAVIVTIIKKQMVNMFMLYGQYYRVVISWGSVFLYLGVTLALILIISTIVTYKHSSNFKIHKRENDE